jgi:hypothetical protein
LQQNECGHDQDYDTFAQRQVVVLCGLRRAVMIWGGRPLRDHDGRGGGAENGDGPVGEEDGAVAEGADDQCGERRSGDPGSGARTRAATPGRARRLI